jgi:two-component system NtrC family sensor kinase
VVERDEGLPIVNGDPAQLNQVIVNVVVNAIQAMPDGGTLTIRTLSQKAGCRSASRTPGKASKKRIRIKFSFPSLPPKEVDEGTGLGLSVVYGIVNEHGGCIEVDSKKGHGSTFEIKFPV